MPYIAMIEVSFKQDIDYFLNGYRHFQRLGFAHYSWHYKWWFLAVAIPTAYFSITSGTVIGGSLILSGLSAPIIFNYLNEWMTCRNFSKSPFADILVTERFDEFGFNALSDQGEVKLPWSSFTDAVNFSDGFLLLTGPRVYYWIPLNAFVDSEQISNFANLVQSQIKKYRTL